MGSRPRGAWTHWRSWTSVDTSSHAPSAHKRVSPLVRWPYRLVPLSFLSGGVVQLPMYYCSHTVLAMKEVLGFRVCCSSLLLLTLVKSSLTVTGQLGQHWPIVATLQGAFSRPFQSQLELIPLTVGSVASVATITLQARSARTAQSCGKRKITELNAVAGSLIPMPACSCRESYSHACLKEPNSAWMPTTKVHGSNTDVSTVCSPAVCHFDAAAELKWWVGRFSHSPLSAASKWLRFILLKRILASGLGWNHHAQPQDYALGVVGQVRCQHQDQAVSRSQPGLTHDLRPDIQQGHDVRSTPCL